MTIPENREGLLIENANLIDVDSGAVVPDVTVLVRQEMIADVWVGEVPEMAGRLEVIDAGGRYLMPGLFDMHVHLGNGGIASYQGAKESEVVLEQFVLYGVTTILEVGGLAGADQQISEFKRRERAGEIVAPRIFATGNLLTVPGGHPMSMMRGMSDADRETLARMGVTPVEPGDDLTPILESKKELGLDGVKVIIEGSRALPDEPGGSPKVIPRMSAELAAEIVEEADAVGLAVFAHATSADELADAARAGARGIIHSVDDALIGATEIELMKAQDVYYVPTLATIGVDDFVDLMRLHFVSKRALRSLENPLFQVGAMRMSKQYEEEGYLETALENLARLHAAGVPIAVGSDTALPYIFPGCSAHVEMQLMARAGLSNAEILRMATLGGAEFLGVEDEMGNIAPGHLANLLILERNPLEDLANISSIDKVILKGRVINVAELRNQHGR